MDAPSSSSSADVLLTHAPSILALARGLLRDEHLVEDVVQETWLRFLRRGPRERAATRSWLGKVTRRLSFEGLRERSRRAAREERAARAEALPSVAEELAHAEVLRSVVEAVLALDEPYRTSLMLAYWRGWDARRITAETGVPLATVRSRLQRAHQKIRERLDRAHGRESWAMAMGALGTRELAGGVTVLAASTSTKLVLGAIALVGLVVFCWRTLGTVSPPSEMEQPAGPVTIVENSETTHEETANEQVPGRAEVGASAATNGLRFSGAVIDSAYAELGMVERGSPQLPLTVTLYSDASYRQPISSGGTTTDVEGRFAIEIADPGTRPFYLRISAKEDEHYRMVLYKSEISELPGDLVLTRAPHGVLHGIVVDDRGSSLAGARLFFGKRGFGREAVSAGDGRFSIADVRTGLSGLEVELPGYSLLDGEKWKAISSGGWEPMRVRLGREAALRLRVTNRSDQPLAGAVVAVELDESERAALEMDSGLRMERRRGTTDEGGIVTLPGLWANYKLRLTLQLENVYVACDGVRGGELALVADGSPRTPIVLAPGEMRELVARLGIELEIGGVVVFPGGSGAAGALVTVLDAGEETSDWWNRTQLLSMEADGAGRFAGRLLAANLRGPLQLTGELASTAQERSGLRELGYAGGSSRGASVNRGFVTVDPADTESLRSLEIVLEPLLSISGHICDEQGNPVGPPAKGMTIAAKPAGSDFRGRLAWYAVGQTGDDGSFRIDGLTPGVYELFVWGQLRSFPSFFRLAHKFPDIEAGSTNVELRLPVREDVKVRVRMQGSEATSGTILLRKLFPWDPAQISIALAEPEILVGSSSGWPQGATPESTSFESGSNEWSDWTDARIAFEGREYTLPTLEAGWYAIGVRPRDPDGGEHWFPQATPPLRFEGGEYVIDFRPVLAGTLRGRVVGDTSAEFVAVTLVDASGTSLAVTAAMRGREETTRIVEISAGGTFVLHLVPTGQFRLRAGSREELERGEYRRELPIVIRSGENPSVEIRL